MNITLSADKDLVQRARDLASQRGTSLNQMIRNYLEQLTRVSDVADKAEEFAQLATDKAGASQPDFVFDREEAHMRGGQEP